MQNKYFPYPERTTTTKAVKSFYFLYALIVMCCFYPYKFDDAYLPFLSGKSAIAMIAFFLLTILLFISRRININTSRRYLGLAFVMQSIGFSIYILKQGGNINAYITQFSMMALAVLLVALIDSQIGLASFFKRYNKWLLLMAIGGTVTFFLVLLGAIGPLYPFVDSSDDEMMFNYILTFTQFDLNTGSSFRYAGFFDEPGAIAYWGMYGILMNRMFIKNERIENLLIICLLFTFSLGFYAQLALYFVFFRLNTRNIGKTVLLVICLIAIIIGFNLTKGTKYNFIYKSTIERVISTEEQSSSSSNAFAIDNRENQTNEALRAFEENPLFGGNTKDELVTNNIYEPLALYGIVGSFFILFPFIMLVAEGIRNQDTYLIKVCAVIFLGFAHRPFHNAFLYFFIIYAILYMYKQMYGKGVRLKNCKA